MVDSEYPKLICPETGTVIDINSNPFSIGRSLSCNYVVIRKPVSRVHCILEKDDSVWILRDTSTNGSLINNTLHKGIKSAPLKDGDVIKFDQEAEPYVFRLRRNVTDDISDEQLCNIADSVLDGVEAFEQETRNRDNIRPFYCGNLNENAIMDHHVPVTSAALQDHLGMARTIIFHVSKKPRTQMEPTDSSTTASRSSVDLIEGGLPTVNAEAGTSSNAATTSHLVDLTASSDNSSVSILPEKEEPSSSTAEGPSYVTSASENSVQPPQAAVNNQETYDVMENELQCAICSELFVKAVTLQCSHTFCKYCIEMWKKTKSECPICRKKITRMTTTLVLDNVIEKVMESSSEETKQHRNQLIEERKALENAKPPTKQTATRGRGRGRRGRGGTRGGGAMQGNSPTVVREVGNAAQRDVVPVHVIDLSSDSNSDWDDYSDSNSDTTEWQDGYNRDDWYDGLPRNYYGGYGHCYCCGRPGHWANGCPFR